MANWLRSLFPDPTERQRRRRLASVIEDVVSHTEPRLRAARRYRRRLEGPIEKSLLYGEALAWAIPGPFDFSAANWSADPLVHAFFSSVPAMRQCFSRSRELRAFFEAHPHAQSCYCLLFAERQLKTVFTTRQLDGGIPQEMATTSVTFAQPLPCLPTADEADLRGQLGILVFNGVTRAAVALLATRKKDRKAVEEQQALLTLRMRLARDAGKCLDSLMAGGDQADQGDAALQRDVAEVERGLEVLRGVKGACGRDFPVMVKLNSTDFLDGGLSPDEAVRVAVMLEADGFDAIEVSGGMAEAARGSVWPGLRSEDEEGYFVENAARVKRAVRVPVSGLGGIRTLAVAERIVREGLVDLVSLSRPLIREPLLVKDFREGSLTRSACISCNKCFNPRGIRCGDLVKKR